MDESRELTQSLEDYLEAIYKLNETGKPVRGSYIANLLQVKRPSVTSALRSLEEKGYVVYQRYVPITLTELGEKEAKRVIRRHKAMEIFLERILGVDVQSSKESACRLEHAMSDEVTTRLVEFVEFIDSCPRVGASLFRRSDYHCRDKNNDQYCAMCIHGCLDEIVHSGRTVDLSSVHRESKSLLDLYRDHETMILVQVADELRDSPDFSPTHWRTNKTVHILPNEPSNDSGILVQIDDQKRLVSFEDAAKIEVIPCE
ncbi:MAG: metal-dependent transcriptional regulator [Thermoguttaceae bacterium]|nr:metal-dependent transcriptional regulator [Thermoguttaceae bacterium]